MSLSSLGSSFGGDSERSFDHRLNDIDEDTEASRGGSDEGSQDEAGSDNELVEEKGSKCGSHSASEHPSGEEEHESQIDEEEKKKLEVIDELVNPPWALDPGLGAGDVIPLNKEENQFFKVYQSNPIFPDLI